MEKVRGRIKRVRQRFELPTCWRPKKEMPNRIYTVLERHSDSQILEDRGQRLQESDCKGGQKNRLSHVSAWDNDDDSLGQKDGRDCWSFCGPADGERPTIRVATFDVALFSLAPAIPPDHPCSAHVNDAAAAAVSDIQKVEPTTPSHFLSSESSSIFSNKSKSTSSDASSGVNTFSNATESIDSIETCAILSQHASKPTQTFNFVTHPELTKSSNSPVFNISRVWKFTPSSRQKPKLPYKPALTVPTGGKNIVSGNVYHSKLNPVFGLTNYNNGSSRSLMDSLPTLFNEFLSSSQEKATFSPALLSGVEFSSCESPCFQLHMPDRCVSSPEATSNAFSPPRESTGTLSAASAAAASSILDILLEVDADIIALQEVRAEEERGMKPLSELAEALGMEYAYAESWAPEFGNAVLSRWPIKSASVQQLHDETDYRNVLKVVVEVPLAGDLHVYCTQLDHLDEDWRMKQVDSFLQLLPASCPHILAGNLNSLERSDYSKERWEEIAQARKQNRKLPPSGDVLQKLVEVKGYLDAKVAMGKQQMETWLQLRGQGVDGTCQHGTRVDYILGSPELPFEFVPGSYSVISARGTSNHDLAVVDLQTHCFRLESSAIRGAPDVYHTTDLLEL